jgi:uncharacterized membrane protein
MRFVKNQLTFLLYGFVFWLPIAVLIYIIVFLFNNVENFYYFFFPNSFISPVSASCLAY